MIAVDLENIIIGRLSGELKCDVITISIFSIIIEGTQPGWVMMKVGPDYLSIKKRDLAIFLKFNSKGDLRIQIIEYVVEGEFHLSQ